MTDSTIRNIAVAAIIVTLWSIGGYIWFDANKRQDKIIRKLQLESRLPLSNGGSGTTKACPYYIAATLPYFPSTSLCAIVTDAKDEVLHYDGTHLVSGGGNKMLRLRWDGNKWVVVSWWQPGR